MYFVFSICNSNYGQFKSKVTLLLLKVSNQLLSLLFAFLVGIIGLYLPCSEMKHNNVLPNAHFKKDWDRRVKTWFDQAGQKRRRRLLRKEKAAAIAPRPAAGLLRPVVHCTTQKYNMKTRLGRGFTLQELKVCFCSVRRVME